MLHVRISKRLELLKQHSAWQRQCVCGRMVIPAHSFSPVKVLTVGVGPLATPPFNLELSEIARLGVSAEDHHAFSQVF